MSPVPDRQSSDDPSWQRGDSGTDIPSFTRDVDSLVGRQDEIRAIDELINTARGGGGGVLVLRGEAGIGKSTLLDHARNAGSDFQVLHATGSQFESELPFAALHQLCRPLCSPTLDFLGTLSAQHQEVLQVAFGLADGRPSAFRVGLATLELLACAARERPLLCSIDDAQWLDAASSKALAFIARRIDAEPIAVTVAMRPGGAGNELGGLPDMVLEGLSDSDARALLAAKSRVILDEQVRDRLVAEARGNPLALLHLPRADSFTGPDVCELPGRIERGFAAQLVDLPVEARQLLIIASADPTGDPGLLWPAARLAGIDVAGASTAVTATQLVEFSTRVCFCHPLARSAIYLAADDDQRRSAHQVLAETTDPARDPDRRAWHRARASTDPDEDLAAELERCASRAQSRGGIAAAAAFIERAAQLSLDPAKRTERTFAAARAWMGAGAADKAEELLTTVSEAGLDERQHAECDLLRGQVAFIRHINSDGPRLMVRAGQKLATVDPQRSRECFLDALEMSFAVGRPSGVMDMVLAAARDSAPAPRAPDILDALTLLTTRGHRAAVPLIRKILDGDDAPLWTQRPAIAVLLAAELWDPHTHWAIIEWLMKTGRESGSPIVLRLGLAQVASGAALKGDVGQAMAALAEEEALADAIGGAPVYYARLQLAALRGRRREALDLIARATDAATARGTGQLIANVHWASAVLHNGLADYPTALTAAEQAVSSGELFLTGFTLPELVEAAVRCGQYDTATTALDSLTDRTDASATATGLGIAAYSRALVTGVEDHYQDALRHLNSSSLLPYRARAHLLYGEWLGRERRRQDSRVHLRTAYELLSGAGLEAFARRAATALRATGVKTDGPANRAYDQLTMQEIHVARLVAGGATSNEVAARLFISPRTVDTHLRNIFRKLGITSRKQLRQRPDLRTEQDS
ncbi:helix-turn-helix transcriptional regulator [Pseudonocardia spinosispora]|uniref:helix-turn-helix transcriptional regulator n=1 Tax=Pseudonocardia spinosispora TaxID=103441 RepID=UPI000A047B3A